MQEIFKNIRLSEEVIKTIIELAKKYFGNDVKVWIFGSRVDPKAKGGDIDIYLEVNEYKNILDKKLDFLVQLDKKIGEQKVDLVIKPFGGKDFISKEARETGVRIY